MIKIRNIQTVFLKQAKDYKIRLIIMIPFFLLLISVFLVPIFSAEGLTSLTGFGNYIKPYSIFYPSLNENELTVIIYFDIKLIPYLLMIAIMAPMFLTTEAIVSEKENRTIENLFSLPISDGEIIIGKIAVSFFTTLILIVAIYFSVLFSAYFFDMQFLFAYLTSFKWILLVFLLIPSLNFLFNLLTIFISGKVNNVQTANYLVLLCLVPFFIPYVILTKSGTLFFLNINYLIIFTAIVFLLNLLFFKVSIRFFNRERILINY